MPIPPSESTSATQPTAVSVWSGDGSHLSIALGATRWRVRVPYSHVDTLLGARMGLSVVLYWVKGAPMDLAQGLTDVTDFEAELVSNHAALHRRLTLVLHDPYAAQDIAQAAIARALEQRRRFTGGDVRAWLYTIGLRLAFNELRRLRRARSRSADEEPTWAMTTDPDLWLALRDLEPRHRAALLLSTLEGYTHAEIGAILGVAEGTVSSWLSKTKDRLRQVLAEDD